MTAKQTIEAGKAILGIEFGSTRIKAVLIDQENKPIAQGAFEWENQLVDGLWTYSIDLIWKGLQDCYADLRADVQRQYSCDIESLAAIGFSAMIFLRALTNPFFRTSIYSAPKPQRLIDTGESAGITSLLPSS